jgi:hypothetical protein
LKDLRKPSGPQGNEPNIKTWLGVILLAGAGYALITHWQDILKALAS